MLSFDDQKACARSGEIAGLVTKLIYRIFTLTVLILTAGHVTVSADCAWDCHPRELSDVVYMVSIYRGSSQPYRFCDCGQYGEQFPVCADLNGNCVPFELADIVTAFACYRGYGDPALCPDCL
jgi:hypothetical protein